VVGRKAGMVWEGSTAAQTEIHFRAFSPLWVPGIARVVYMRSLCSIVY